MQIKLYDLHISAVDVKIYFFLSIFFHKFVFVFVGLNFAVKPRTKFLSQDSLFLTWGSLIGFFNPVIN